MSPAARRCARLQALGHACAELAERAEELAAATLERARRARTFEARERLRRAAVTFFRRSRAFGRALRAITRAYAFAAEERSPELFELLEDEDPLRVRLEARFELECNEIGRAVLRELGM